MRTTIVPCAWWVASAVACSIACSAAPVAEVAVAEAPAVTPTKADAANGPVVRGRIEAIAFRNINKAQGHYTYNVELAVRHGAIEGEVAFDRASIPAVLTVRVDKVFFGALAEAEQAAIAPEGPRQELSVQRWGDYAVGAEVALAVEFTAPTLAVIR